MDSLAYNQDTRLVPKLLSNRPYSFKSKEEYESYIEHARHETLDSLFNRTYKVWKKYIDADEFHLKICAADTIFTYFQDKLGMTHYLWFTADNDAGKSNNLKLFNILGYRNLMNTAMTHFPTARYDNDSQVKVVIENDGNAAATNMSIIFSSCDQANMFADEASTIPELDGPFKTHSITNGYTTVDVMLSPNDESLEPGATKILDRPLAEIRIPKLVQGSASFVNLYVVYSFGSENLTYSFKEEGYGYDPDEFDKYAIYDQGSTSLGSQTETFDYYSSDVLLFYFILYAVLASFIGWYVVRRQATKAMKTFLSNVIDNIMKVRGALRGNHTNKNDFSDVWNAWNDMADNQRRRVIKDIPDYILIDDFYSELRKRNLYLSDGRDNKENDLSETPNLSKLNEALLASAENALNKVDWNKYR